MALKSLLGWLGRKAFLYVIIASAMLFALLAWPQVKAAWNGGAASDARSLEQTREDVEAATRNAREALSRRQEDIRGYGRARLAAELGKTQRDLADARALSDRPAGWLDSVRPSKILERKKLEIRVSYLENEAVALKSALAAADARLGLEQARARQVRYAQVPSVIAIEIADRRCQVAREATAAFRRKWWIERELRARQEKALLATEESHCSAATRLAQRRDTGLRLAREYKAAAMAFANARDWQPGQIKTVTDNLERATIFDVLKNALLALLVILVVPYLIRVLFYFVFAPMAQRRGAVRVDLDGAGGEGITAGPSSTTVALRLARNEELLVRQGYLQSTSWEGRKATRWLLDWRRPLSSLASGLSFLTRVRGEGETTTISAVEDPFAEVAMLVLPEGASCVLHPRALVAVAQPLDCQLKISSHWRLTSLSAWLTLQLRYLAFHGPARLVIKGGRGVRAERAERGRVFGQDQLVGFSSDLAYSVSRTETFWPYFFGRESLLKDRVAAGGGLLIIEEAPFAGARGRGKRGIEGVFDAFLNAFGL